MGVLAYDFEIPPAANDNFVREQRVAQVDATGNVTYIHTDKQNSVVALSNSSDTAISRRGYGTYGETNPTQMAETTHPFGYTGRRWEADLGLYYYRARWYDPELGTFLETDPVGSLDYINLYSYVGINPMNATDPTGMKNCKPEDTSCVETPNSANDPNDPNEKTDEVQMAETVVVTAQRRKRDSRDKRITFYGERELMFEVTAGSIQPRQTSRQEVQCDENNSVIVTSMSALNNGAAAAHTHPSGISGVPGPGDNSAANQSTIGAAFVLTGSRVFTIERGHSGTYRTTIASGPPLTASERSNLVRNMENWENSVSQSHEPGSVGNVCN